MRRSFYLLLAMALPMLTFVACSDDDDVTLRDISVNFASASLGIDEDNASAEVGVSLSRSATAALTVTIDVTAEDLVYGTHYTTTPAVSNGQIQLPVASGANSATITVTKVADAYFDGTETVSFKIASLSLSEGIAIGNRTESVVTFGAITSEGDVMTLEGKTEESNYTNMVYVDLSSNTQTLINRTSWNLGFYCGDEFRVFLNPSLQMAAAATPKTNIADVGIADVEGLPTLVANMMASQFISMDNVDAVDGSLTGTAIAEVSATDAENLVYIMAMEEHATPENFYKVKVSRTDNGYSVTYGLLGGTTTQTVEVNKDSDYNMVGVSFDTNATVLVEPKSKRWDIQWAYGTGVTTMAGMELVYFMQDLVSINTLGGVEVAELTYNDEKTALAAFNALTASAVPDQYSNERNTIGTSWRFIAGGMNPQVPSRVEKDRFYVIKDPDGNLYKLKFNAAGFNNDGAQRGRPVIEYALLN